MFNHVTLLVIITTHTLLCLFIMEHIIIKMQHVDQCVKIASVAKHSVNCHAEILNWNFHCSKSVIFL